MSTQQKDLGFESVEPDRRTVPLDEIRPTNSNPQQVRDSVEAFGLTTLPLVQETDPDSDSDYFYKPVDGRRRIEAAREAEADEIEALVMGPDQDAEASALTFVHNNLRSPSPLQEADAIDDLLSAGYTEEALRNLGVPQQTINKRLRLANAPATIKDGVRKDEIAVGVAERVANLSDEIQDLCVAYYGREGQLRHKDVKRIRQQNLNSKAEKLPDNLFGADDGGDDGSPGGAAARPGGGDDEPQSRQGPRSESPRASALSRAERAAKDAVDQGVDPDEVLRSIEEAIESV